MVDLQHHYVGYGGSPPYENFRKWWITTIFKSWKFGGKSSYRNAEMFLPCHDPAIIARF